jgi:predicted Kef-type K+ transport protein
MVGHLFTPGGSMTTAAVYLVVTFSLGLLALALRLPPLVGFLAAGFVLNAMQVDHLPMLEVFADLGVTLMLFAIGLKLDVRILVRPQVWVTASVHLVGSVVIGGGLLLLGSVIGVGMLAGADLVTVALLALALSFSSTVFVVKLLEERGESQTLYGRVAVGILVIQDLVTVIFLTVANGHAPSPWALTLVGLVPLVWLLRKLWSRLGHGEMQSLFGIAVAIVPGYVLFTEVGLKGDLGALLMGVMLASHPSASELSRSLFHIKEILLVGFFVSIGLTGLPDLPTIGVALLMLLLLHLRNRTSLLAGLALMNYSEFALIVVSIGVKADLLASAWLVEISIAVALSFVVAALFNSNGARLVERWALRMPRQDPESLLAEERPGNAQDAEVVILGMGRVGIAAYDRLAKEYSLHVLGVDSDGPRVEILKSEGRRVIEGDATDLDFWRRLQDHDSVRLALLAMPRHGANIEALRLLRSSGFRGKVAAVARYRDEVASAESHGVQAVFNVYSGAGLELADQIAGLDEHDVAESIRHVDGCR